MSVGLLAAKNLTTAPVTGFPSWSSTLPRASDVAWAITGITEVASNSESIRIVVRFIVSCLFGFLAPWPLGPLPSPSRGRSRGGGFDSGL